MGVLVFASLLALLLAVEGFKIPVPDQDTVQSKIYKKQAALPRSDADPVGAGPAPAAEDSAAHSAYSPLVYDYSTPQLHRFTAQDGIGSPTTLNDYSQYERLAEYEAEHAPSYKTAEYQNDDEFDDEEQFLRNEEGYTHYKTTSNVAFEGPHQIEEIETKSFHKEVPKYDTVGFKSHDMPKHHGKHKEVHYHQHKHMHKHEHKQEHVHQHKQEHKHAHEEAHKHGHEHKGEHKHDHHEDHKHGHEHKSEHKHGHHEGHKHGHEHKEEHKHGHHASHKHGHHHKHHGEHKHDHHHGHKHHNEHKHHEDHKHKEDHHHGHKHDHHEDHKHHEDHGHKHDHHHGHKHHSKHGHKHENKHGHKHSHHHSKH